MDLYDSIRIMLNQPIERKCVICSKKKLVNANYICYDCWVKNNP